MKNLPMQNLQIYKSTNLQIVNKFAIGATVAFAYLLICLFAYSASIRAQEILPLSVVPPKQEVLINPGETYSTTVKFLNLSDTEVSGTLTVADFIVEDGSGTPVFLDNPQVIGTTMIPAKYSAAKWTTLQQNKATILSKDNVAVPVTINVPKNAAPGGRYVAVLFQPVNDISVNGQTNGQSQAVKIRLASLIYIRVAGPITENAVVTKFEGPSFLEYGPASVTTEISNKGDYHITPKGTISMADMFGRTVSKADLESKNIFPGTSRSYSSQLGEKLMFGKFTVSLNASYGDQGKLLTSTFVIWLFPWHVALAILLGIVIIILAVMLWYKKFKKKEEKLVEELKEEKTELEELKEELKDKITSENKPKDQVPPTPPKESTP